jgi:iron complex outermembrane recepter protein
LHQRCKSKTLKAIFLNILFTISFLPLLAVVSIKGKVIDAQSKEPIAFASVFFLDIDAGTSTNELGEFAYSANLPQNIKIKVKAIGYETKIIIVSNPNSDAVVIELTPTHMELHEVSVSTTTGVLQRYSITNIETKTIAELNTIQTTNLGDAIANIPSVYNMSTGIGISKPVIRGLSGMRVVTYLNGLRIENQQWGGDHGMGVTENGIGGVEIIKGPSSLLYGADALGGVVYFTDENYAKHNHIEAFAESQFETNTMRTRNFSGVKLSKNNLRVNLFGSYYNSADYQLPNGNYVTNSRFKESNLKASVGYNKKNWVMNLRYNYVTNRIGLPGHTHDSIIVPELFQSELQRRNETIPVQLITNHYTLLENTFYFNKSDVKIWLGNTYNKLTEFDEKVTIPGVDKILVNNIYNVRYRTNSGKSSHFIIGSQGMFQQNINGERALEILIPDALMNDVGVYALFQTEYRDWELQTGLRFDNRAINSLTFFKGNEPFSRSYNGFNYSAGAAKSIKKFLFRANVSSGFRPPHLSELLSNGVHHGTLRFEIGDKNLQSELATQLDISAEYSSDHIRLVVNPFYNYIQNYIYITPQNLRIDGMPVFNYTQTKAAELYGGDVGVHYHPHFAHQLHFEHTVSYIHAQDDANQPLPLIPQTRFNSILRFEFKNKQKFQLENISLQHLYFLPQNNVVSYETTSPSYQLIHIGANFKWESSNPIFIKIGVRNLLNENYIDHLSRLKDIGLEAPGRNIYVSLKMNINYKLNTNQ